MCIFSKSFSHSLLKFLPVVPNRTGVIGSALSAASLTHNGSPLMTHFLGFVMASPELRIFCP